MYVENCHTCSFYAGRMFTLLEWFHIMIRMMNRDTNTLKEKGHAASEGEKNRAYPM